MVIFTYNLKTKEMTQDIQQQVAFIMLRFDFQKVHNYMQSVDWKWGDSVPSIEELRLTACRVLMMVIDSELEASCAGTGGFRAYKFPWGVELVFSIECRGSF